MTDCCKQSIIKFHQCPSWQNLLIDHMWICHCTGQTPAHSNHNRQSHSNYRSHADAAFNHETQRDQIKHSPPENNTFDYGQKMNINDDGHSQRLGNFEYLHTSTGQHTAARDDSASRCHSTSLKMLSHHTLTTCISMQQQNKISDTRQWPQFCLRPLQIVMVVYDETKLLHKPPMQVRSINTLKTSIGIILSEHRYHSHQKCLRVRRWQNQRTAQKYH